MQFSIARIFAVVAGSCLVASAALAQVSAPVPVPEPASWTIVAVGLAGAVMAARRNRRK